MEQKVNGDVRTKLADKIRAVEALTRELADEYADMIEEVAVTHTEAEVARAHSESRMAENAFTHRRATLRGHFVFFAASVIGAFVGSSESALGSLRSIEICSKGSTEHFFVHSEMIIVGFVVFHSVFVLYFYKPWFRTRSNQCATSRSKTCGIIPCCDCCDVDMRRALWGSMLAVIIVASLILDQLIFRRIHVCAVYVFIATKKPNTT